MRSCSMIAFLPRPARSQVSRARCNGLTRTSSKASLASTGRICSARRRPLSVKGRSVTPVCCPLRVHAVSPCLIANRFTAIPLPGSDVVGLGRTDPGGCYPLPPGPARDLGHVIAIPGDVGLVFEKLVSDRLLGVGSPGPELGRAVDHIAHQVIAIEIVQHAHVERRGCGAL